MIIMMTIISCVITNESQTSNVNVEFSVSVSNNFENQVLVNLKISLNNSFKQHKFKQYLL